MVFPKGGYQGDYIGELAAGLRARHGEALVDEPGDGLFRETAETQIFGEIRKTLSRARRSSSTSTPTSATSTPRASTDRVLADLERAGLLYDDGRRALVPRHGAAGSSATAWW